MVLWFFQFFWRKQLDGADAKSWQEGGRPWGPIDVLHQSEDGLGKHDTQGSKTKQNKLAY